MAEPTAPTLQSITVEGLKKAGINDPTTTGNAALLSRAQTEWMAEIKWDISLLSKELRFMQTMAVMITTQGQAKYALPTDYSHDLKFELLDGNNTGIAQGGALDSITLAAIESLSEAQLQGYELLVYAGTAKGGLSHCTAFNSTTKVATVKPDFAVAPVNLDSYMRVETYAVLPSKYQAKHEDYKSVNRGTPLCVYIIGDADNGEFIFDPVPYRTSGIPWGVKLTYYADLQRVDLASTLMSTLYRRWRNIFVAGIKAKKLDDANDKRAESAISDYKQSLVLLNFRESYGFDQSNLQQRIV